MMKLVMIHGRSQQRKNPAMLQQEWEGALRKGLSKADLAWPEDLNVSFPFYGDELDKLLGELEAEEERGVNPRGSADDKKELSFYNELYTEMARKAKIPNSEIQKNFGGKPHEMGPLNWAWVQAILKALDHTALSSKAIAAFTRDVYAYLTNGKVRKAIDSIVAPFLDGEPCVVVGHSLGTVVGYNVLRQARAGVVVKRYVTVGSPLGIKAVKQELAVPLSMPQCTKDWFNAMDERDVVALYPLDRVNFPIRPPVIKNKTDVANHTKNRHGIVGYLDDLDVARSIHSALISPRP